MPRRTHISSILLLASTACAACAQLSAPVPASGSGPRAERIAVLDRITAACRVARSTLILVGEDELHFRPAPEEDYERVDCVLRKVQAANLRLRTMGFVGNEAPEGGNAQAH